MVRASRTAVSVGTRPPLCSRSWRGPSRSVEADARSERGSARFGRPGRWPLIGTALLALSIADGARALNGFRLDGALVPREQILRGGPPRDGIPALDGPAFVEADRARWADDSLVVGVLRGGRARAYPLALLVWHELVNDELGGDAILVSYCPLCGTALVFDRRHAGVTRRFGVSGLLYRSDLLMFDRESESLWSQIGARAVTGPLAGGRLRVLRSSIVTWGRWRRAHPATTVLTRETGHRRDYGRSPYRGYDTSRRLLFPIPPAPPGVRDGAAARRHPKAPTLGLRIPGGASRAYPADEITRAGGRVEEEFAGHRVVVGYDAEAKLFHFEVPDEVEVIQGFWFAWMAFHPQSSVFSAVPEYD